MIAMKLVDLLQIVDDNQQFNLVLNSGSVICGLVKFVLVEDDDFMEDEAEQLIKSIRAIDDRLIIELEENKKK